MARYSKILVLFLMTAGLAACGGGDDHDDREIIEPSHKEVVADNGGAANAAENAAKDAVDDRPRTNLPGEPRPTPGRSTEPDTDQASDAVDEHDSAQDLDQADEAAEGADQEADQADDAANHADAAGDAGETDQKADQADEDVPVSRGGRPTILYGVKTEPQLNGTDYGDIQGWIWDGQQSAAGDWSPVQVPATTKTLKFYTTFYFLFGLSPESGERKALGGRNLVVTEDKDGLFQGSSGADAYVLSSADGRVFVTGREELDPRTGELRQLNTRFGTDQGVDLFTGDYHFMNYRGDDPMTKRELLSDPENAAEYNTGNIRRWLGSMGRLYRSEIQPITEEVHFASASDFFEYEGDLQPDPWGRYFKDVGFYLRITELDVRNPGGDFDHGLQDVLWLDVSGYANPNLIAIAMDYGVFYLAGVRGDKLAVTRYDGHGGPERMAEVDLPDGWSAGQVLQMDASNNKLVLCQNRQALYLDLDAGTQQLFDLEVSPSSVAIHDDVDSGQILIGDPRRMDVPAEVQAQWDAQAEFAKGGRESGGDEDRYEEIHRPETDDAEEAEEMAAEEEIVLRREESAEAGTEEEIVIAREEANAEEEIVLRRGEGEESNSEERIELIREEAGETNAEEQIVLTREDAQASSEEEEPVRIRAGAESEETAVAGSAAEQEESDPIRPHARLAPAAAEGEKSSTEEATAGRTGEGGTKLGGSVQSVNQGAVSDVPDAEEESAEQENRLRLA